ncbi:uncharacterized protein VTP21DRAFT_6252 [Calcarisporiella thermophila]|uniref:uncharacterized protein n=1 Tax=Calcarisporiella thermophila TaxID=911321 RepID=UPI0037427C8E
METVPAAYEKPLPSTPHIHGGLAKTVGAGAVSWDKSSFRRRSVPAIRRHRLKSDPARASLSSLQAVQAGPQLVPLTESNLVMYLKRLPPTRETKAQFVVDYVESQRRLVELEGRLRRETELQMERLRPVLEVAEAVIPVCVNGADQTIFVHPHTRSSDSLNRYRQSVSHYHHHPSATQAMLPRLSGPSKAGVCHSSMGVMDMIRRAFRATTRFILPVNQPNASMLRRDDGPPPIRLESHDVSPPSQDLQQPYLRDQQEGCISNGNTPPPLPPTPLASSSSAKPHRQEEGVGAWHWWLCPTTEARWWSWWWFGGRRKGWWREGEDAYAFRYPTMVRLPPSAADSTSMQVEERGYEAAEAGVNEMCSLAGGRLRRAYSEGEEGSRGDGGEEEDEDEEVEEEDLEAIVGHIVVGGDVSAGERSGASL